VDVNAEKLEQLFCKKMRRQGSFATTQGVLLFYYLLLYPLYHQPQLRKRWFRVLGSVLCALFYALCCAVPCDLPCDVV
jgi:hypothetical protein